jgi:hypothetical protein
MEANMDVLGVGLYDAISNVRKGSLCITVNR